MSKYHARKMTADGITFDSMAEHRRYCELRLLEINGEIRDLNVHVRYKLEVNGCALGHYEADFVYLDGADSSVPRRVVEDVKGVRTAVYRLKKKLMLALHQIEIQEVDA